MDSGAAVALCLCKSSINWSRCFFRCSSTAGTCTPIWKDRGPPFRRGRHALKQEARQPNSAVAAELNRRKEPLEGYPLDSMSMVGSVQKQGRPYALLRVDNLLYQVKAGDYLGQNYGKILKITETEISLREIVQDAAGEWIERPTTLQLQEGGK